MKVGYCFQPTTHLYVLPCIIAFVVNIRRFLLLFLPCECESLSAMKSAHTHGGDWGRSFLFCPDSAFSCNFTSAFHKGWEISHFVERFSSYSLSAKNTNYNVVVEIARRYVVMIAYRTYCFTLDFCDAFFKMEFCFSKAVCFQDINSCIIGDHAISQNTIYRTTKPKQSS